MITYHKELDTFNQFIQTNMTTGRIQVKKQASTGSTLPEIGKIKIGEKKKNSNGVEYPTSLDYFRPTGHFDKAFTAQFGAKPTKLTITFASEDITEVCNERYECWTDGKRWGYGDGVTFTVFNTQTKQYDENIPADDPRVTKLKWDMMLTLRFVLVEMKGILGYWTFQTKGKAATIPSIIKSFDWVRERAGAIVGFPFTLMVEKKKGYSPGDAKNYPVVTLVPNFSEESIEKVAAYLEAGGSLSKITTRFIQSAEGTITGATKQIEAPKVTVEDTKDLFSQGEEVK